MEKLTNHMRAYLYRSWPVSLLMILGPFDVNLCSPCQGICRTIRGTVIAPLATTSIQAKPFTL